MEHDLAKVGVAGSSPVSRSLLTKRTSDGCPFLLNRVLPDQVVRGLRSAPVGAEQTSPGCLAPHLPHGSDCCGAGAHGSRSRLRLGRCRTDVPRRLATHLPHGFGCGRAGARGSRSPLCTLSSVLKWGKLHYTDFVQNCILDQKERTSL